MPSARSIWLAAAAVAMVDALGVVATMYLLAQEQGALPTASSPVGWVAVTGAIIAFGSYGILIKLPGVGQVHPQIFQVFYSCGVFAASILVLTFQPFVFSWWGFLGAAIWIGTQLCAFVAINNLGYGVAVATWASITMVVSFVLGAALFGEKPVSLIGGIGGLASLAVGVTCVAAAQSSGGDGDGGLNGDGDGGDAHGDAHGNVHGEVHSEGDFNGHADVHADGVFGYARGDGGLEAAAEPLAEKPAAQRRVPLRGWTAAAVTGVLNGSLMLPLRMFTRQVGGDAQSGIEYLASFALGVVAVTPLAFIAVFQWPIRPLPPLRMHVATLPGVVTGLYWAIGNLQACYATIYLGQAIGYPLTQTGIVIAGLWSVVFFKEVQGMRALSLFALGVVVIIAGSVLLGLYG